ncbi:hypothetical protein ABT158_38870 [Nonomuraea sp. NPDC001636]|uniref:hypothetical protein n=1 Tax=Nonomuraea sp. NPDC001636 TaxID=3154391 RepID=UPI00331A166C
MRRYVAAIVVVSSLLAGCAISFSGQRGGSPSRFLIDPPPVNRALADLSKSAKGKVLLHHVDEEGQARRWTTKLKMGASFRLEVDCVGASGTIIVRVGKSQLPHQCSIDPGGVRVSMIPDDVAVRSVKVEAPEGAKWAILIWKPPQS